jgi:integrase
VQDIVQFLYLSAWRSGEAQKLDWNKADLLDWVVRLSRRDDKTKMPHTLALAGELREIIERRLEPAAGVSVCFPSERQAYQIVSEGI